MRFFFIQVGLAAIALAASINRGSLPIGESEAPSLIGQAAGTSTNLANLFYDMLRIVVPIAPNISPSHPSSPIPSVGSKSSREPLPFPYWFGLNYTRTEEDPLCDAEEEYNKMVKWPTLCLSLEEEMIFMRGNIFTTFHTIIINISLKKRRKEKKRHWVHSRRRDDHRWRKGVVLA